MGLLQRLHNFIEKRSGTTNPSEFFIRLVGGRQTSSGVSVTEVTALKYPAVWAAVNLISRTIGTLPLSVFRGSNGTRERMDSHPAFKLIHRQANPFMDALIFKETVSGHVLTWGNGYAEIQRNVAGRPIALWPITPDKVTLRFKDDELIYEVRNRDGVTIFISDANMLHIKGLGFDGFVGYSPIRMMQDAIGVGVAAEDYAGKFFKNDATPPGAIKVPKALSDDAYNRIKDTWQRNQTGDNRHKPALFEEGMDWVSIGLPAKDAQLLETRQFSVVDIARIYQIPPHMLSDLSKATFSNIEHQGIEFVNMTLMRWLTGWEMELNRKLFTEREQDSLFVKFNVNALVRGDMPTRFNSYATGRQWGWLSANDVRALEDMNPIENGDVYLSPMNMIPAELLGKQLEESLQDETAETEEPEQPNDDQEQQDEEAAERMIQGHRAAIEDVCKRICTKEQDGLRRARVTPERLARFRQTLVDMLQHQVVAAALSFKSEVDVRKMIFDFVRNHPPEPSVMADILITELQNEKL